MNKKYYATEIDVDHGQQTLTIVWADGHRTVFPLEGLRLACPCVECAGGHDKMGRPIDPAIFHIQPTKKWNIQQLREVGNYALQIVWGDGHDDGLYRWEDLRHLCPCDQCSK